VADFLSAGWKWYVGLATLISLFACAWLLRANSTKRVDSGKSELHGDHVWDGDLQEYDNGLPRWWAGLFYLTILFSLGYLVLYPGLTITNGLLSWSSRDEYREEVAATNAATDPLFAVYLQQDVKTVANDKGAQLMGARLFQTYCVQCHGSDMRGSKGFPNLVDGDWLYPGTPDGVKATIMDGRGGVMPAFEGQLKAPQIADVTQYVMSLSGRGGGGDAVARGDLVFKQNCAACHGVEAKGNQALGAPNLTDSVWLYGGSAETIRETISRGRQGRMPAQKELLGEARVHLLAAYVYAQALEQSGVKQ